MLSWVAAIVSPLLLAQTAHAWGFVSHAEMACAAIRPDLPLGACTCGDLGTEDSFIGADAPDGFFFAAMDDAFAQPGCITSEHVHDLVFAGHMLQRALNTPVTPAFNPVEFAMAFGSHMVVDSVGFHIPGGILWDTDGNLRPWFAQWPLMSSIDTLIYLEHGCQQLPTRGLSMDGARFLSESTIAYNAINPSFAAVDNASAIHGCTELWAKSISAMEAIDRDTPREFNEHQLLFFSPFNASSVAEAKDDIAQAKACAVHAVRVWVRNIEGGMRPEDAFAANIQLVDQLFDAGQCTPSRWLQ